MKRRLILCLILIAVGCGDDGTDGGAVDAMASADAGGLSADAGGPAADGGADAMQAAACSTQELIDTVFVPVCGACHGAVMPQGELDLVSADVEARLVGVDPAGPSCAGAGIPLVTAGDATGSLLYQKVERSAVPCGSPMPLAMALSAEQLECVSSWIGSL
jgi:hypothetical protein